MAVEVGPGRTRRSLLRAVGVAAAAAVAGAISRSNPVLANTGDPLTLGQANVADAPTDLTSSSSNHAFKATSAGAGIWGDSTNAIGVTGTSSASSGMFAQSVSGIGLDAASMTGQAARAMSNYGTGFYARCGDNTPSTFPPGSAKSGIVAAVGDTPNSASNTDEVGIYGFSDVSANSTGVWGDSVRGIGVAGSGDWGVFGVGGIGVYALAASSSSYALYTSGKIKFNGRSGRTTITSGHSYRDVTIAGMTTGSAVVATLQTHVSGYYVASVISYSGKFRLYLNKAATSTLTFSYLVIG